MATSHHSCSFYDSESYRTTLSVMAFIVIPSSFIYYVAEVHTTLTLPCSTSSLPPLADPPEAFKTEALILPKRPLILHAATILWLVFCAVVLVAVISFWRSVDCVPSDLSLNPDIAGMGVRLSLWIPGVVVIVIAFLGHYHAEETGIKTINGALLAAEIYYGINLAVQDMSLEDTLIGGMVLDCLTSITAVTFSMKECLAARQLIRVGHIVQFLAFGVISVAAKRLGSIEGTSASISGDPNEQPQRGCMIGYWWGPVDTCGNGVSLSFWMYFTIKLITFAHSAWLCFYHMQYYDAAEKSEREDRNTNCPILPPKTVYDSIPATTFTKYQEWIPPAIVSIINIELTVASSQLTSQTQNLNSWGQTAQLVITGLTLVSWIYAMYSMFKEKSVRRRQEFLYASCHGSMIPILSAQRFDASSWLAWAKALPSILRYDHPFGKLPLRSVDHARIVYQHEAWQAIQHDFRQWPYKTRRELGVMLVQAVQLGDLTEVQGLLLEEASMEERNDEWESILTIALNSGRTNILKLLLAFGAHRSFKRHYMAQKIARGQASLDTETLNSYALELGEEIVGSRELDCYRQVIEIGEEGIAGTKEDSDIRIVLGKNLGNLYQSMFDISKNPEHLYRSIEWNYESLVGSISNDRTPYWIRLSIQETKYLTTYLHLNHIYSRSPRLLDVNTKLQLVLQMLEPELKQMQVILTRTEIPMTTLEEIEGIFGVFMAMMRELRLELRKHNFETDIPESNRMRSISTQLIEWMMKLDRVIQLTLIVRVHAIHGIDDPIWNIVQRWALDTYQDADEEWT